MTSESFKATFSSIEGPSATLFSAVHVPPVNGVNIVSNSTISNNSQHELSQLTASDLSSVVPFAEDSCLTPSIPRAANSTPHPAIIPIVPSSTASTVLPRSSADVDLQPNSSPSLSYPTNNRILPIQRTNTVTQSLFDRTPRIEEISEATPTSPGRPETTAPSLQSRGASNHPREVLTLARELQHPPEPYGHQSQPPAQPATTLQSPMEGSALLPTVLTASIDPNSILPATDVSTGLPSSQQSTQQSSSSQPPSSLDTTSLPPAVTSAAASQVMNEKQQQPHPPAISETTPSPPATTTHDPGEAIEKLEALAALHSFNLTTTGASNAGATDDKSGNPLGPSGQHSSISEEEARYNRSLPSNNSLHVPVHHGVALASCTQVDSSSSSPTQSNTSKSLGDKEESELYARGKETALSHGAAQASDTALQLNESEGNAAHPSIKFHHVPQRGGPWDVTTHEPSFFPLLGTRMPLAFIWRKSTTADEGWQLTFLVAESAILQKAGAPKALGIYPCRAFKGPTTRGGRDGEELGHYGGQVLASEPTERLADAAALPFVRQGHAYLLTMRVTGQEGWHVCAGDLQSVLPFLFRVNDPKGTLLKSQLHSN